MKTTYGVSLDFMIFGVSASQKVHVIRSGVTFEVMRMLMILAHIRKQRFVMMETLKKVTLNAHFRFFVFSANWINCLSSTWNSQIVRSFETIFCG